MARSATVRVAIVSDNSDLARGLKDSEGRLKGFGKSVVKVGVAAGLAAGAGLAIFGKAAVEAASQAEQSLGATETVFGRFAGEVTKTSSRAAAQFGLNANEYRESANLIGSLFKNQGVQLDALAGQTKSMIGTASDLAATFGGPTSDAVEALASAFKGEFDPLEKYGISVKQAQVTTEAWTVANVDSAAAFKKLTDKQQAHAKQVATSNLLMGQAAQTTGAFARETDTLAHQQQVLGAKFTNLKARIGTALLPVVTDLFKVLNKDLMPTLNQLATRYLPPIAKALRGWIKSGGAARVIEQIGAAIRGVSWGTISTQIGKIKTSLSDVDWSKAKTQSGGLADTLTVFGVAVGFAADHVDTLVKIMPLLLAGFVLFKSAQALNNIAGRDSVFGLIAQIYQTRQLKIVTDQLAVSLERAAIANGTLASSTTQTGGKLSRLGGIAKGAAGLAGIGLMTSASDDATGAMKTLKSVGGGALTGFAVGGPIGAAVGAGAGLLLDLATNTDKAAAAAKQAIPDFSGMAGTIDQLTGALTEASRATLVQQLIETKGFDVAAKLGISRQTYVDALMGERDAMIEVQRARQTEQSSIAALKAKRQELIDQALVVIDAETGAVAINRQVEQANKDQVDSLTEQIAAREGNVKALDDTVTAQAAAIKKQREINNLSTDWAKRLKGLPTKLVTNVQQHGGEKTMRFVAQLAKRYKLTPKQIKTTLKAFGFDTTQKQVDKVREKIKDLSRAKPDLSQAKRELETYSHEARRSAATAGDNIGKGLKDGTRRARADLSPFKRSVRAGTEQAKQTASAGAQGVGSSLKSGVLLGLFGLGPALASQMASAVRQGINAARSEAGAHSPSRETEKLGKDLTQGLINGVQRGSEGVERALEQVTQLVTTTLERGLKERTNALNRHFAAQRKAIENSLKGKPEAKALAALKARQEAALKALEAGWKTHTRKVRNHLRGEIKDLREIGRQQDALASGNFVPYLEKTSKLYGQMTAAGVHNLEEAREHLAGLVEEAASYAANIKDVFVNFADITQLGVDESTGAVTFAAMISDLQAKAQQAQDFAAMIQRFAAAGLSQTVIDQLIAAGPEQAFATAQAIATGIDEQGQAAIDQINGLTGQIATAGEQTGAILSTKFYDAGIKAAEGLVSGLEAKSEQLDKIARRMAKVLIKALKEELGIHSPSAVMAGIGGQISQGLAIGVNDTHARTAGQSLAAALVSGFGTPGLRAELTPGSLNGPGTQRIDVTLRAPQINELERGRSIQIALDTYHAAGGRAQAR